MQSVQSRHLTSLPSNIVFCCVLITCCVQAACGRAPAGAAPAFASSALRRAPVHFADPTRTVRSLSAGFALAFTLVRVNLRCPYWYRFAKCLFCCCLERLIARCRALLAVLLRGIARGGTAGVPGWATEAGNRENPNLKLPQTSKFPLLVPKPGTSSSQISAKAKSKVVPSQQRRAGQNQDDCWGCYRHISSPGTRT